VRYALDETLVYGAFLYIMSEITYKQLGTVVKRQGFLYRQRLRDGNWAIYEQLRKGTEKLMGFELIRIGRHNGFKRIIDGVELNFPPAETYPTSSMWGSRGWTLPDYDSALRRMKEKMLHYGDATEDVLEDNSLITEMLQESSDEDIPCAAPAE